MLLAGGFAVAGLGVGEGAGVDGGEGGDGREVDDPGLGGGLLGAAADRGAGGAEADGAGGEGDGRNTGRGRVGGATPGVHVVPIVRGERASWLGSRPLWRG